jgi:hypothetical protein
METRIARATPIPVAPIPEPAPLSASSFGEWGNAVLE